MIKCKTTTAMSEPNKLYESDIIILHKAPLIGTLCLECDEGPIEVALNRTAAETLQKRCCGFLPEIHDPLVRAPDRLVAFVEGES